MASSSSSVICFIAVLLVLQPWTALSDFWSPLLSPVTNDICKEVKCGKGTCKPSHNITNFLFECECHPGWKQTRSDDDDGLKFLPCVVPNCSLNYSCMKAPSSVQEKQRRANESIFDPCHWIDCGGGGSCNKTSDFTYNCACSEGYYNLLNVTAFPCFEECAIGLDCKNLGISMSNKSASATPTVIVNSSLVLQRNSCWLIILMMFMAMLQWK